MVRHHHGCRERKVAVVVIESAVACRGETTVFEDGERRAQALYCDAWMTSCHVFVRRCVFHRLDGCLLILSSSLLFLVAVAFFDA